ncbi:MAG: cell division protein ZapE [Arenicellales bacterium]|nr:cell division protein ZapE [Arenicellales bacterium]
MTPIESYHRDLKQMDFVSDPEQEQAVRLLQGIYDELVATSQTRPGILSRMFVRKRQIKPIKGLYLWGGVGRGKTYVVDQFFDCLPFENKKRIHFHRFMRKVHEQLKKRKQLQDPLAKIATGFANEFRVLCFDEFSVNDITDAMILGKLLGHLFDNGVTLVTTSNIKPDDLYKDGLQRDRFQPAIDLIKQHTIIHEMKGSSDYRLRFLEKAEIYFHPHDNKAAAGLKNNFEHVSSEHAKLGTRLDIDGREIQTIGQSSGVVWFDFDEICGGPRSQNDYLELARCFHTIVVSDIPKLTRDDDDSARRFINLVDILYDRNVKFMGSGCCPPDQIYQGDRLRLEFDRAASRLVEMQSTEYLAKPHLP